MSKTTEKTYPMQFAPGFSGGERAAYVGKPCRVASEAVMVEFEDGYRCIVLAEQVRPFPVFTSSPEEGLRRALLANDWTGSRPLTTETAEDLLGAKLRAESLAEREEYYARENAEQADADERRESEEAGR